MAVSIRLKREGSKNKPFYRIVVADKKATGSGRYIEKLGYYDPLKNKEVFVVEKERLLYWTNQGAEISARIKSLLKRHGVLIPPAQEGKRT